MEFQTNPKMINLQLLFCLCNYFSAILPKFYLLEFQFPNQFLEDKKENIHKSDKMSEIYNFNIKKAADLLQNFFYKTQ